MNIVANNCDLTHYFRQKSTTFVPSLSGPDRGSKRRRLRLDPFGASDRFISPRFGTFQDRVTSRLQITDTWSGETGGANGAVRTGAAWTRWKVSFPG